MQAILCKSFAPIDQLVFEEVPSPEIKKGHVLIEVSAAGVNFPDSLLVEGLYQMKPDLPFIPGSEVAGVIKEVGEGVAHLKIGQKVIGLCMLGGYAQEVLVPATHVLPIPDQIPLDEAAGLVTAHATAHHALKQRASIKKGETLLVTGAAGGTGLAAVQIGKEMGATVIAVCSTKEKCDVALANGADHAINYTEQDLKETVKSLTNKKGVDVVYECVGGDMFHTCSRLMGWNGRLLVIGFAGGEIPEFPVNLSLVKGYSVVGVFWGSFTQHQPQDFMDNMKELVTWYMQGKVKVNIDKSFALKDSVDALKYVTSRQVKGKVVILP
ncbi:NADPH:quinone oxidoreductase family protein [Glaciecola sp. KUL10]|uniref:NADPH:quinone oxidoreductase family protein n=1 Tax=Glaciecola sp. (strain KUL10) TaxID=2161813 RepID=UPI000D78B25A|nr:NADPH:quinone oxidoreductase family protein [Glaciecola sp. KUL10]GBL03221.1 zinc-binding alcohol dehydrogenase [Glaciecola sp. KUL10]